MLSKQLLTVTLGVALAGCAVSVPDSRKDERTLGRTGLEISVPTVTRINQRSFRFEVTLKNSSDASICIDHEGVPGAVGIEISSISGGIGMILAERNPPEHGLGPIKREKKRLYSVVQPGESVSGFHIVSEPQFLEFVDARTMVTVRDYVSGEPLAARAWVSVFPCELKDVSYARQQRAMTNIFSESVLPIQF